MAKMVLKTEYCILSALFGSGVIFAMAFGEDVIAIGHNVTPGALPDIVRHYGVVCDRGKSAAESVITRQLNISSEIMVTWHYIDCRETFEVVRSLHLLENDPGMDAIILQCRVSTSTNRIVERLQKKILKLNILPEINDEELDVAVDNAVITQPYCHRNNHVAIDERNRQRAMYYSDDFPAHIMANVAIQLKWKIVHLFYDKTTGYLTRMFVDRLSLKGTLLNLQDIDDVTDLHDFLQHLYDAAIASQHELDVVVMCSRTCIFRVLHVAGVFDSVNTEHQTMVCFASHWLLLVPGFTYAVRTQLSAHAGCLHNVAYLAIPGNQLQDTMVFQRILSSVIEKASFRQLDINRISKLTEISTNLLSADPSYTCDGFYIDTLYHTRTGRDFHTVCYMNNHNNVSLLSDVFPNAKFGYNQKVFKVTTLAYSPFVITRQFQNRTVYEGPFIDLLQELSRVLNFSYTLGGPPDGKWGSVERWENETPIFNGLIGQIQRHECDFAAAPLSIHPTRDLVVDFSYPVYHEYTSVLVRSTDPNDQKWRTLVNPLKAEVLLAIGAVIPVVTLVLFIVETFWLRNKREISESIKQEAGHTQNNSASTQEGSGINLQGSGSIRGGLFIGQGLGPIRERSGHVGESQHSSREGSEPRSRLTKQHSRCLIRQAPGQDGLHTIQDVSPNVQDRPRPIPERADFKRQGSVLVRKDHGLVQCRQEGLYGVRDAIWCTIGTILGQGGMRMPASFSGSALLVTWWLFGIVIVGTYCGNLIAFLTVTKVTLPFNNLQEMAAKQDEFRWGVAGGTNLEIIFKTSTSPELREIGDAMLRFNTTDPGIFDTVVDNHIERVKLEKYAYIGETTELKLTMLTSCDLMKVKGDFYPVKNAFVFQETSPYTRIFSEQIMKIVEAGLFEMWLRKWWPKSNMCDTEAVTARSKPISVSDVQGAFYICLIGLVTGLIALLTETVIYRLRNK